MSSMPPESAPTISDTTGNTILLEFGRLSGKVDLANQKLDTIQSGLNDHEARIRTLEAARNRAAGWGAGVGAVAGVVAAIVSIFIHNGKF